MTAPTIARLVAAALRVRPEFPRARPYRMVQVERPAAPASARQRRKWCATRCAWMATSSTSTMPSCARMPLAALGCLAQARFASASAAFASSHTGSIGTDACNQALSEASCRQRQAWCATAYRSARSTQRARGSAIPLPERHAGKPAEEPARRCRIPHCGRNHRASAATTGASADGGMGEGDRGRPGGMDRARPA